MGTRKFCGPRWESLCLSVSSAGEMGVMMSPSPQNCESEISTLVPAVFLVFKKMN